MKSSFNFLYFLLRLGKVSQLNSKSVKYALITIIKLDFKQLKDKTTLCITRNKHFNTKESWLAQENY